MTELQPEAAIRRLEVAPVGVAGFDSLLLAARTAVSDSERAARSELFALLPNATADAIAEFVFVVEAAPAATFDAFLLDVHAAALAADNHSMSRLIRSRAVLGRMEAALSRGLPADHCAARVSCFVLAIAEQLVASQREAAPAAASLLIALRALLERVAAVEARHAAHAHRVREDTERARLEKARQALSARRAAVEEMRNWFLARPKAMFPYAGEMMPGGQFAEKVLGGSDAGRIAAHRVRHAIAIRKSHEPNFECAAWLAEIDQEAEAALDTFERADKHAEYLAELGRVSEENRRWHAEHNAKLNAAFDEAVKGAGR